MTSLLCVLHRYELWRLGDMRLVTRAHVRSALQPAPNSSSIPGAGLEVRGLHLDC